MLYPAKQIVLAKQLTRKKTVSITIAERVSLYGGYWDSGSRTEWSLRRLSDGARFDLSYPSSGGETPTVEIPVGHAVVRGGISMGKDAMIGFYVRVHDLPELMGWTERFDADAPASVILDWARETKGMQL